MATIFEEIDPNRYHYFDTPDGQDIFKKWLCVMKPTIPAAIMLGASDVLVWSFPKGYAATLIRFTATSLPVVGIASTFVLATNGITCLRKKDDRLNWFLGGFVTGTCFGLWKRSKIYGFNVGMALGILAFVRKEMLLHGWPVTPTDRDPRTWGGVTECMLDFSFTKERPRSWTTGA